MTVAAQVSHALEHERIALVDRSGVLDPPRLEGVDRLAQLVLEIVALADGPVDPSVVIPAALVLSKEGLIDCPQVTFGCNYDLDIRSFELRRGYARAIDAGWLTLRARKVCVNENFRPRPAKAAARARAQALYSLERSQLMLKARHHLLRDGSS